MKQKKILKRLPKKLPLLRGGFLTVLMCLLMAGASVGTLSAEEQTLPSAEDILERYVNETGGRKAYQKVQNRVSKMEMEIKGAGIKMELTLYQGKPNKAYMLLHSAATGKIEMGSNGEVAWEKSATSGPQIYEGKVRANVLHQNKLDALVYWKDVYKKIECLGTETVDGKTCYKVVLTPHETHPQTIFFDKKTGLLIKMAFKVENPMGTIPMESYALDYRKVDGLLIPFKSKILVMGQERSLTIGSVEHNVKLPENCFQLPEDIKALLNKNKQEKK